MTVFNFPDTTGRPTDGSFIWTAPNDVIYVWDGDAWRTIGSADDVLWQRDDVNAVLNPRTASDEVSTTGDMQAANFVIDQATADVTLAAEDPAADRIYTFPDAGADRTVTLDPGTPAATTSYVRQVTDAGVVSWEAVGADGASVHVGDNPPNADTPTDNEQGDLWYNTDDGRLYVWYVDENTSQWVDASPAGGDRNWIINGNFNVNQRNGTRTPGVGVYGFDRWKGHANGLEQVVEALPAGTYTLSWTGGGNGTFGGTTAASPITETVTAGDTSVVVPSDATLVQLERGTSVTPFEHRPTELTLCQRYYFDMGINAAIGIGMSLQSAGSGARALALSHPTMRAAPTCVVTLSEGTLNNLTEHRVNYSLIYVTDIPADRPVAVRGYTADAEFY